MAQTGRRKKWLWGLLILLVGGGIAAGWWYWNRPLLRRAALLKEGEKSDGDNRAWLPDHRRWLVVEEKEERGYDSDTDTPNSGIFLHSEDLKRKKGKFVPDTMEMHSIQGVTSDYRIIASDWPNGKGNHITLYEMGFYPNS